MHETIPGSSRGNPCPGCCSDAPARADRCPEPRHLIHPGSASPDAAPDSAGGPSGAGDRDQAARREWRRQGSGPSRRIRRVRDVQGLPRGRVQQLRAHEDGSALPQAASQQRRRRSGCENCHGPGQAHAEAGGEKGKGGAMITFARDDKTPIEKRNAICLSAATPRATASSGRAARTSARDVACTSCHKVMEDHSPRSQARQGTEIETCGTCHLQKRGEAAALLAHAAARGQDDVHSCHNPHGTVDAGAPEGASLNANCYRCHAEKRGPFLWQHAPVVESCANCHDPHGTNHENMLEAAAAALSAPATSRPVIPPAPTGGRGVQRFVWAWPVATATRTSTARITPRASPSHDRSAS